MRKFLAELASVDLDNNGRISFEECVRMWSTEIVPYEQDINRGIEGIRKVAKGVDLVATVIILACTAIIYGKSAQLACIDIVI